jgi:hypothetical protein
MRKVTVVRTVTVLMQIPVTHYQNNDTQMTDAEIEHHEIIERGTGEDVWEAVMDAVSVADEPNIAYNTVVLIDPVPADSPPPTPSHKREPITELPAELNLRLYRPPYRMSALPDADLDPHLQRD